MVLINVLLINNSSEICITTINILVFGIYMLYVKGIDVFKDFFNVLLDYSTNKHLNFMHFD